MLDLKSPSVGERFDGRVRTLAMASLFVVRLRDDEADVVRGIGTEDLQIGRVVVKIWEKKENRGRERRKVGEEKESRDSRTLLRHNALFFPTQFNPTDSPST
jgi:hypothetical protein